MIKASAVVVEAPIILLERTKTGSYRMERQLKLQNPLMVQEPSKIASVPAVTPKKRRKMANVLDVVLRYSKMLTPAPTKVSDGKVDELKMTIDEAAPPDFAKDGPSESKPIEQEYESILEKIALPIPEATSLGDLGYIVHHALEKQLIEQQIAEVQYYARDLKYPRGFLVYGGNDEDDYLYCLPDNKEIDVCQEMMDNMGYPKLELGLSAMPKDHLVDCLAYNNLKVSIFYFSFLNFQLSRMFFFNSYYPFIFIIIFY
jgi:hypothetical protein